MRHLHESRFRRSPAQPSTIVVAGAGNEDSRLILVSGLTYLGYRVRLATTGDELLCGVRAGDVSLVIAEVGLPCADGPCAIEVLKGTPELRHIPVLVYSAPARVVGEARALASGADRFVGDPAHLSGVFEVVVSMHEPAAAADSQCVSIDDARRRAGLRAARGLRANRFPYRKTTLRTTTAALPRARHDHPHHHPSE